MNGHERPSAYPAVKAAIERNAIAWRKPLYSQWLVETNHRPDAWTDMLAKVIDTNDRLFVCRVNRGSYQGLLTPQVWEWLNARV